MSDSIVALFSMGALFGMFLSIIILSIARYVEDKKEKKKNEKLDNRKYNDNHNIYIYVLKRDWHRRSNN